MNDSVKDFLKIRQSPSLTIDGLKHGGYFGQQDGDTLAAVIGALIVSTSLSELL